MSQLPRKGSVDEVTIFGKKAYRFSDVGMLELGNMAEIGCTQQEMADFFGVSVDWISSQLKTNDLVRETVEIQGSTGARDLRQQMHTLAIAGDTKMLAFLGERRLKMNKEVLHKHEHKIRVIGMQPDYEQPAQNWLEQHAPKDITPRVGGQNEQPIGSIAALTDATDLEEEAAD